MLNNTNHHQTVIFVRLPGTNLTPIDIWVIGHILIKIKDIQLTLPDYMRNCALAYLRKHLCKHLCKYSSTCALTHFRTCASTASTCESTYFHTLAYLPKYLRTYAIVQVLAQTLAQTLAYLRTCALCTCALLHTRALSYLRTLKSYYPSR